MAAGTEDTDAVNVAQIKGLAKKIVTSTADYRLVKNASSADGSYTVDTNGDIDLTVEDKNHAGQKETVKLKDIASKSKLDDVINKGLQFDANVGGVQTNKLGSKITVKGEGTAADTDYSGENLKTFITQDPAGNTTIDVKMNKNLKAETIVATGENGKDGKIGINGKDGQTTNISVTRDGKPGVDGAPGTTTTRIVYEKPDGTKEEVATLNDGMKYGGDTGAVIKKKLNEQVNVIGGITDTNKLTTEDNLGVVSDGSNNLKVRLAKALKGLESVTTGDTVMDNNGVTINNGAAGNPVSLTKNGLNNGGNKITNVAAGVNGTDAVNVNQLNTVFLATNGGQVFTGGFALQSYDATLFAKDNDVIWHTYFLGLCAIAAVLVLGVLIAYLSVRKRNTLNSILDVITMFPFIIPGSVLGIAFVFAFNKSPIILTGTALIMIISFAVRRMPYTVRSSTAILGNISPSIEEAAISLGASDMTTFRKITVPMMMPGVLSGAIMSWVTIISELSSSIILYTNSTQTLTVSIYTEVIRGNYGNASAYATILTVTSILSLLLFYKVTGRRDVSV